MLFEQPFIGTTCLTTKYTKKFM